MASEAFLSQAELGGETRIRLTFKGGILAEKKPLCGHTVPSLLFAHTPLEKYKTLSPFPNLEGMSLTSPSP